MKLLILLCLTAVALARPQAITDEKNAETLQQYFELREDQSYDLELETSNGILRDESGISYPGEKSEEGSYVKSGSWEFTHPNGDVSSITFIADENGYRPEGDVIPVFSGRVDIQDA